MENWKRFLDECEILLNTDLIKLDELLRIHNSVNNDIQFSMELIENKLLLLIIKSGKNLD